jgi:hypothetical protein
VSAEASEKPRFFHPEHGRQRTEVPLFRTTDQNVNGRVVPCPLSPAGPKSRMVVS